MMRIYIQKILLISSIFLWLFFIIALPFYWKIEYQNSIFMQISEFCETMIENNPEMEAQVFAALKEYTFEQTQMDGKEGVLQQYGYDSTDFISVNVQKGVVYTIIVFAVLSAVFFLTIWYGSVYRKRRIKELTDYLEQINDGFEGRVLQKKEDEFSMLEDVMQKMVSMLFYTKEEAIKSKKQFADNLANIAHQWKTPITAALLSVQLMEKTQSHGYTKQIKKQLNHLNDLEEQLLTLSKIDTGTLHLEKEKIDIYTVLTVAVDNLEELLEKEEISVSISEKGAVWIQGDMEWTMEAIMNLMKNCMEHSQKGGCIYCDYSVNPLYTEILIWDEGNGFCQEDIPHLFERFFRGKMENRNGMGIGLYLAQSIFQLQNGCIRARNISNGGACFEIRIYSH